MPLALLIIAVVAVLGFALSQVFARPPVISIHGSPLVGRPAPTFELATFDGATVRLADYRGRPVVINFWASYCIPCREEFPVLKQARERHADQGLEVLGIVHDDTPEAARAFANDHGANWPLLLDPDDTAWRAYGGQLLPITFYVDRQGIVRSVSFGAPPPAVLEQQLAKIF